MDHRKLIKFGNTSHVISIPNNWLKKNNLKKGDTVYIQEESNNELIILPETIKKQSNRDAVIHTNSIPAKRIRREIISEYMKDHRTIILSGKRENYESNLQELIQDLIGVEIVEETSNKLVLKDFIDIQKVSVTEMLQRTDLIIRSMIEDMIQCLKKDLYDSINPRDITINKLRFLILKVLRNSFNDALIMNKLKEDGFNPLYIYTLLFNMEDIADNTRRIARRLVKGKFTKQEKRVLERLYKDIQDMYLKVIRAYHKNNPDLVNEVANRKGELATECEAIIEKTQNKNIIIIAEKCKVIENSLMVMARAILDK